MVRGLPEEGTLAVNGGAVCDVALAEHPGIALQYVLRSFNRSISFCGEPVRNAVSLGVTEATYHLSAFQENVV